MSKRARGVKKGVHNIAFWPILPFLSLPNFGATNLLMQKCFTDPTAFFRCFTDPVPLPWTHWPAQCLPSPYLSHSNACSILSSHFVGPSMYERIFTPFSAFCKGSPGKHTRSNPSINSLDPLRSLSMGLKCIGDFIVHVAAVWDEHQCSCMTAFFRLYQ